MASDLVLKTRDGATAHLQPFGERAELMRARFDDGEEMLLAADLVRRRGNGDVDAPYTRAELRARAAGAGQAADEQVIPVVREEAKISKRRVDRGGVRLKKRVHEREEVVDVALTTDEVQVARVPVDRFIDEPVGVRQEGDKMIVPVLEEVLVVQKRLLLKEELHITRQRKETRSPQRVTLRSEDVDVERIDGDK